MPDESRYLISVTDGTTTYYIDHGGYDGSHLVSSATSEADASSEASYVVFTELSGATTITVSNNGTAWKAGVAGFQIIPEPTTLGLLSLGGVALLRRRRRAA